MISIRDKSEFGRRTRVSEKNSKAFAKPVKSSIRKNYGCSRNFEKLCCIFYCTLNEIPNLIKKTASTKYCWELYGNIN